MFHRLKKNKGETSILLVIIIIITLIWISGYYKMVKEEFAMDEIQSILDITGITTLEKVIDHQLLKDELFGLDANNKMDISGANQVLSDYEDQIKREYRKSLKFNKKLIPSYTINVQDVYFENSNWGKEGVSPQIVLETVMTLELNIGSGHDFLRENNRDFYSGKKNDVMKIESIGSTTDGKTEIIIRSTVRSVYE